MSLILRPGGGPSVDQFVGDKLKNFREEAGESQAAVASILRLSLAEMHKLELGKKRISASQLFVLARHFNVPVASFFGVKLEAA